MKKSNFIASLMIMGILYLAYLISVIVSSNVWSNILSPMVVFLAGSFLFITYRQSKRTHKIYYCWLLFALGCLSWVFADIQWAIFDLIFKVDAAEIEIITFFYTLTNVFLTMGTGLFLVYQFKSWNIAKLILDTTVFSFACIFLMWIFFFGRSNIILSVLNIEGVYSLFSILGDIFIAVGIVVWYLSIRNGKIPLAIRFIAGGLLFFALTDLYYYYVAYNEIYLPNSLLDAITVLSLLIIAIGGLLQRFHTETDLIPSDYTTSNVGKFSKELLLLAIPVLVVLIQGFTFTESLIFITLIIIYLGLNSYFQASIKNESLLKKELKINTELESIIAERTQKLSDANVELSKKNIALKHLSNTDGLTQLYNRRYFLGMLEKNIAALEPDKTITLFYMDLDRFKLINDTYGHGIGDKVLIEISNRLSLSTSDHATVARMGGDEFVFASTEASDHHTAIDMARQIIDTCSQAVTIDDYVFYPALCIGISIYPNDAQNAEMLIKNADISLYHAKSQGINKFAMFSSLLHEKAQKRNEIELFLRKADFYKNLRLYYQPQFSIPDCKLIGVEALIRWVSVDNKIMTPDEFIRVAEETDHIDEIGIWVLREAVEQIILWNSNYNMDLKMGINISPKQLNSNNLFKELQKITERGLFDPKWLDIEITESIAMDSEYRMSQIFTLFKSIGMSVSIDDFGTGYSSISYLKHYTFDRIKIAKPLIDSIVDNTTSRQIVQAIIILARTIGIHTIAEGVETKEQLDVLTELGCEQIQGFLLGRPIPAENFEATFLAAQNLITKTNCADEQ